MTFTFGIFHMIGLVACVVLATIVGRDVTVDKATGRYSKMTTGYLEKWVVAFWIGALVLVALGAKF